MFWQKIFNRYVAVFSSIVGVDIDYNLTQCVWKVAQISCRVPQSEGREPVECLRPDKMRRDCSDSEEDLQRWHFWPLVGVAAKEPNSLFLVSSSESWLGINALLDQLFWVREEVVVLVGSWDYSFSQMTIGNSMIHPFKAPLSPMFFPAFAIWFITIFAHRWINLIV